MRIILASILFFLSCNSAEKILQKLRVKNNSNQDITIYYHNHHIEYIVLKPSIQETIQLPLPQNITIHFKQLDYQQEMNIDNAREPLLIQQENSLSVMQNGRPLSPKVHFSERRPSLSVREDDSIN